MYEKAQIIKNGCCRCNKDIIVKEDESCMFMLWDLCEKCYNFCCYLDKLYRKE